MPLPAKYEDPHGPSVRPWQRHGAKRRYPAHFLSKMTDANAELQESQHWIDTAYASGYLSGESKESFILLSQEIGKMIGGMMAKQESFCRPSSPAEK